MQCFNLPLESCEGDPKRLRLCLACGLWRNGARWAWDGSVKSLRGDYDQIGCGRMYIYLVQEESGLCFMR
ncbi:hypothetical protein BDP27DRAFT_1320912 [Rhodocollybia butyracea]|uniref:Uncharacterized protein n=1 Tax=Rhodocollybia butyracea TaxID=206335 RepID=A0A9P5PZF0_9AGAR|nr:hypothetical protein BDP27DRAFT_1320912 [Rhodocollybia butyracea]